MEKLGLPRWTATARDARLAIERFGAAAISDGWPL